MDSLQVVLDSLQKIVEQYNREDKLVENVTWLALIPFVLGFIFIFFVIYRSRREALFRQKEAELNQQISQVEMKALRSQLNPHFIFNCLNSIYQFVHSNDTASAGNYLVKFSKLMRMVLENSIHQEVALADDLEALKMYMDMEKLRMKNGFEYVVCLSPEIKPENVLVPPLIVQPFVENSIWHGLNNGKINGKITLSISREDDMLIYSVEDNGSESNKNGTDETESETDELKRGKKRSLGMSLTKERLEVLNKTKGTQATFTITNLKNDEGKYAGKRVELKLPYQEDN